MRTLFFYLLFGMFGFVNAQTPIVLTSSNMPSAGDTLRYTNVNLNSIGNYTQTGVNMSWNFGAVTSTTEGVRSFKSSFSTPYAVFFATFAGAAEKMPDLAVGTFGFTDYYNFYKKQTTPINAYVADGVGMTFSSIPLPCYYTDKDELYIFPLSYPQHDSTKFKFTTPNIPAVPFRYTSVGHRITDVDGWGTITTPYGTENCLRLVTTQYGMDSMKTNIIIPIAIGFPNVNRSYQWLTANSKIPYFEVSGTLVGNNFVPTTARYRGFKPKEVNTTGISELEMTTPQIVVFPNPVSEILHLSTMPLGTEITVYDNTGKLVQKQKVSDGTEGVDLNVSNLPKGIYSISFSHLSETQVLKFVKE